MKQAIQFITIGKKRVYGRVSTARLILGIRFKITTDVRIVLRLLPLLNRFGFGCMVLEDYTRDIILFCGCTDSWRHEHVEHAWDDKAGNGQDHDDMCDGEGEDV